MSRTMRYAERFADIPQVLDLLGRYPGGLRLAEIAAALEVPERRLREELLSFFVADVADPAFGIRDAAVEFVGPDGTATDAADATVVRLVRQDPLSELGVELLDASQLGRLYRAARAVAVAEPDNEVLSRAVARLESSLVPVTPELPEGPVPRVVPLLRRAVADRVRVELRYARAWRPGVRTRLVEPYQLVSSRRGYELDGAATDRGGALRTFLVSGIREVRLTTDTFEPPADLSMLLERHRRTTPVHLVVPAEQVWVVERFSERVEIRARDDDCDVVAHVLEPVRERVGLILTIAGRGATVVSPVDLHDVEVDIARALLDHHGM